jgi:delta8-fatty-acid desaturase
MATLNSLNPDKFPNGQVRERDKLPATPPSTPPLYEQFQIHTAPTYIEAETRKAISLDLGKYPSLDSANQTDIMARYRSLDAVLRANDLYKCDYASYLFDAFRCCTLFFLMIAFLRWEWYILSAIFLGGFWHQLVFVVHDAGIWELRITGISIP